jgi:hypothetical protein
MKSRSKELIEKSISAMVAAIEIYNKPGFRYRIESFTILSINAWELLCKAKFIKINNNKINCLYIYDNTEEKKKRHRIKRGKSGQPLTKGINVVARELVERKIMNSTAHNNIKAIIEYRDSCIHFYNNSLKFRKAIQGVATACVKNFALALDDWFGQKLAEFQLHIMPLAFTDLPNSNEGYIVSREEKKYLAFLQSMYQNETSPYTEYLLTVDVKITFTRSNEIGAIPVQITNDPSATPVRLTEENIKEKYPWEYSTLTKKCQHRYIDFKINKKFHDLRKKFEKKNEKFAKTRFLDTENPKSLKKIYYNPNILKQFDQYYQKK